MLEEISIELVQAQEADLDEIHALCQNVAACTPTSGWDENYPNREILRQDLATHSLYKVMHEGKILSIMQIRPWADLMAGEEVDDISTWDASVHNPCALGRFCVAPDFQGKGLGRRIMNASLEKARELGYDSAQFHTLKTDDAANHLYLSMGFHKAGQISEYGMEFNCYEKKL